MLEGYKKVLRALFGVEFKPADAKKLNKAKYENSISKKQSLRKQIDAPSLAGQSGLFIKHK